MFHSIVWKLKKKTHRSWLPCSIMLVPGIEYKLSGFMENPFSQILTTEFQILMSCNSIDNCSCYSTEVPEVNKTLLGTH